VTTPEIIDQIHELILEDRQISAKSITEQLGISREQVGSIIHEDLDMQKLSAKTKQQSAEWRHSSSPHPKKFRVQKSAGKFLASIFWDQDGILLIDYLPKGQTINAELYLCWCN